MLCAAFLYFNGSVDSTNFSGESDHEDAKWSPKCIVGPQSALQILAPHSHEPGNVPHEVPTPDSHEPSALQVLAPHSHEPGNVPHEVINNHGGLQEPGE